MFNPADYQWEKAVSTELEVGDIVTFGSPEKETYYYRIIEKGSRYTYQEGYLHMDGSLKWSKNYETHLSGFHAPGLRKAIRCVPYDPNQEPSEEGDI